MRWFQNILTNLFIKIVGNEKIGKLILALYKVVKPIYDAVSYILEQLQSGKITQVVIDYTTEVKSAIEVVIDIIKKMAEFFKVSLPDKIEDTSNINSPVPLSKSPDAISRKIDNLKAARKYAVDILSGKQRHL